MAAPDRFLRALFTERRSPGFAEVDPGGVERTLCRGNNAQRRRLFLLSDIHGVLNDPALMLSVQMLSVHIGLFQ